MAFTTIAEMTAEIVDWSNGGLTTTQAQSMITLAEDRIYREIRVKAMESQSSIAISSGVAAVPSDLIEVKDMHISANPKYSLQRKTPEWIYSNYPVRTESGLPRFYAREGSNFIFGPNASDSYTVVVNYYARPVTAVGGTLSGILLSSPGLLLYASLAEAEVYLGRDERLQVWETKYQQLKKLVIDEDKNARFSGSPLAVTPA